MNYHCSKCQFTVETEDEIRFCPNCGGNLISGTKETGSAPKPVCPVCSTEIADGEITITCPDCQMVYHEECWKENNGCATYGCKSAGCLNPPPLKVDIPESEHTPNSQPGNGTNNLIDDSNGIACPHCHASITPGATVCWSCGKELGDEINALNGTLAKAWTRFGARLIDLNIEQVIVAIIALLLNIFPKKLSGTWQFVIFLPFCLILDSLANAIFGSTLGKWFFGVKVLKSNHKKTDIKDFLIRNAKLYLEGLWLGIPIISCGAMWQQYYLVGKGKSTSYDESLGYKVVEYKKNIVKTIVGVVLCLFFLFLLVYEELQTSGIKP